MSLDISYSGGVFSAPQAKSVGTVTAGTGPYNLASASYDSVSFSFTQPSITSPSSVAFSSDGSKMFVLNYGVSRLYQYTLSTAWDPSSATYNFNIVVNTSSNPRTVIFKSDGTSFYIHGYTGNVDQYDLTTAYNISTASYASKSLSTGLTSNGVGLSISTDGTKLWASDLDGTIQQFTMSTAWDVSTASSDSKSLDVSARGASTTGIYVSPDGSAVYITNLTNDAIYEYDLSTAYDISTGTYNSVSFSVATQETNPWGFTFKDDGSKMYVIGSASDSVHQYSTRTATTLDLSTGNYFSHTPSVNTLFAFNNPPASGTAAGFALALTGANVGEGYDLANASYDSVSFSVASQEGQPRSVSFKTDGTKMYIIGTSGDSVFQYSLSTAWDVSTASYDSVSLSVAAEETIPEAAFFKPDGTSVYITGRGSDSVLQYDLTTAWDVSTGSYASKSMSVTSQEAGPRGLYFKDDGTKAYIVGTGSDTVYQYALSTAWDISTGSFETGKEVSVASQDTSPNGLYFNPDGSKMWISGDANDTVFQYSLSTAWDVSTASYDSVSFSVSTQDSSVTDITFKPDGTKMYIVGNVNSTIFQYTTGSTATATFTYPSSVKFPSGIAPAGPAIGETDVLVFYTDDGGTIYQGFRAGDAMA